jgi:arsenate reductase-like glutaredoxin family protein
LIKNLITKLKNLINKFLFKFGFRISKVNNTGELVKIHKYKNYKEYKDTQIYFNKKKINKVWADEKTLNEIIKFLEKNINSNKIKGICHGSRNGFEQNFFNTNSHKFEVIGTDISETAKDYKNSYIHDFHDEKKEWINNFDFVYSNSLDQSFDPEKALNIWLDQTKENGYVIIEHSDQHGVISSGLMDPFGVEANFFPYLLSAWFGHKISIKIIKGIKINKNNAPVFLFILKKNIK